MAAYPLIFPSLSRQPSLDSSKSLEDDTIRDQMEAGYVATRPRFTRARRTWKFNVRNLVEEDVRSLDIFSMLTTARGGNSFLYPNLLPNWSFEFPATNGFDLVSCWNISVVNAKETIAVTTATIEDGTNAVMFQPVAGQVVGVGTNTDAELKCDQNIPCEPSATYLFTFAVDAVLGTLPINTLSYGVGVAIYDVNNNLLSSPGGGGGYAGPGGWQTNSFTFATPANAASFAVHFYASVTNSGSSSITLDGSASVTIDAAGCALLTPATPYGRMVGTQSLGTQVRFTKLPETSDIGWGGGVKRYGANIELTEI